MTSAVDPLNAGLSTRLRTATRGEHDSAQDAGYFDALLAGRLPREAYADLVAQHFFIYETLERASEAMAADPIAGVFVFPELTRLPSLIADLEFLRGPDWASRIDAVPATREYCERLREVAFVEPAGFIAHHYTRYLGDLSGGLYIGRAVTGVYDLDEAGSSFFRFDGLVPGVFKKRYRELLDAVTWQPEDEVRFLAEVSEAYRLNIAVLRRLGERWA